MGLVSDFKSYRNVRQARKLKKLARKRKILEQKAFLKGAKMKETEKIEKAQSIIKPRDKKPGLPKKLYFKSDKKYMRLP